jgi:hypothetical protein
MKMIFKSTTLYFLLGLFAFSSVNCSFKRYDKREVSEYRVSLKGKTKVSLENFTGKINVYKGDSASGLVIRAEKIAHVKKRELDKPFTEAWVDIDSSSEIIRVKSEYEKSKGWLKFKFNDRDANGTDINYDITIPPGVKFSVENVSGDVKFIDIENDIDVSLVNGDVDIDNVSGNNNFNITNGKIRGSLDSTKGLKIEIINGKVDFTLGSKFSGVFKIETVNGKIEQENLSFATLSSEKKTLRGRMGESNSEINIDIVNGKVILKGK